MDTLLIKLGFSCDIRAAFAEETISLECIADLEPGDFKEAGVKIGDRSMLKQAAAREFASMQGVQMCISSRESNCFVYAGRAPTTTNQPVDPTDNEGIINLIMHTVWLPYCMALTLGCVKLRHQLRHHYQLAAQLPP